SGALAFATRNGLNTAKAAISVARAIDLITRPKNAANLRKVLGIDVVYKATGQYKQLNQIITEMGTKMAGMKQPEVIKTLRDIFGQGDIRAMRFFKVAIPNFRELNTLTRQTAQASGALGRD